MFPGDGFDQATIDKFNTLSRIETEEIRDFLVLHYTATERNDTPFWRHCQAIRRPPTLEQRLEMFERSANIVIGAGELFREPSWFAVLMGQSTWPKSHHPFANNIPDDELTRRLELMSGDVVRRVQTYPMHDEFIRTHCAAPPVPIAEPAT
jgi:tryptophan halogenase